MEATDVRKPAGEAITVGRLSDIPAYAREHFWSDVRQCLSRYVLHSPAVPHRNPDR